MEVKGSLGFGVSKTCGPLLKDVVVCEAKGFTVSKQLGMIVKLRSISLLLPQPRTLKESCLLLVGNE